MKDIELDFIDHKMINKTTDNQNRIAQQVKVAIRSWKEDFFINTSFGINYDNCWGDMVLMKSFISNQIMEIEGVLGINSISIKRDKNAKDEIIFVINAEIMINDGNIDILEILER